MMTLANIPDFHPRSAKAKEGSGVNVLDPDSLTISAAEWKAMMKDSVQTITKLGVRASSEGPGVLHIIKTCLLYTSDAADE